MLKNKVVCRTTIASIDTVPALPNLGLSRAFFKCHLWTCNLAIHDNSTGQSTNFMWYESLGSRSNEIAPCLSTIPPHISEMFYPAGRNSARFQCITHTIGTSRYKALAKSKHLQLLKSKHDSTSRPECCRLDVMLLLCRCSRGHCCQFRSIGQQNLSTSALFLAHCTTEALHCLHSQLHHLTDAEYTSANVKTSAITLNQGEKRPGRANQGVCQVNKAKQMVHKVLKSCITHSTFTSKTPVQANNLTGALNYHICPAQSRVLRHLFQPTREIAAPLSHVTTRQPQGEYCYALLPGAVAVDPPHPSPPPGCLLTHLSGKPMNNGQRLSCCSAPCIHHVSSPLLEVSLGLVTILTGASALRNASWVLGKILGGGLRHNILNILLQPSGRQPLTEIAGRRWARCSWREWTSCVKLTIYKKVQHHGPAEMLGSCRIGSPEEDSLLSSPQPTTQLPPSEVCNKSSARIRRLQLPRSLDKVRPPLPQLTVRAATLSRGSVIKSHWSLAVRRTELYRRRELAESISLQKICQSSWVSSVTSQYWTAICTSGPWMCLQKPRPQGVNVCGKDQRTTRKVAYSALDDAESHALERSLNTNTVDTIPNTVEPQPTDIDLIPQPD
ncbi:hypothetical protein PR048_006722 [Dryococelus australis]|uniref:Uncharacterized protein n=1 Tax=Dryococelus australis TaxID=614101 RepID=A0ABQ9ICD7_9NEOP|nr:hypothetical protein PR048_006722 [Dryococelus australis]